MSDNVNHPSHYNMGGIEVIDAIEAWGFGEGFNRGNAIKYIARAGRKDPSRIVEDLEKAKFYIEREIKRLQPQQLDPMGVALMDAFQSLQKEVIHRETD